MPQLQRDGRRCASAARPNLYQQGGPTNEASDSICIHGLDLDLNRFCTLVAENARTRPKPVATKHQRNSIASTFAMDKARPQRERCVWCSNRSSGGPTWELHVEQRS